MEFNFDQVIERVGTGASSGILLGSFTDGGPDPYR